MTEEYTQQFVVNVYDHSKLSFRNPKEDCMVRGWTSPTTGLTIRTRVVYIDQPDPQRPLLV